jgi:AraC-like DNA-binding protein
MEFSPSEIFGVVSSFLGLLLATIVVAKMKGKKTIRISLILLLLITAVIILLGGLAYSTKIRMFPNLIRIDSPIHYLLGPATYFYALSSLKKDFRFRWFHLMNLLPFIINAIWFMPFYFSGAEYKLEYYNELISRGSVIMQRQYLYKTILLWAYLLGQFYLFYKYVAKNKTNKKYNIYLVTWFNVYLGIQFICYSVILIDHLTGLKFFPDPYKFSMNMTSLLLLSISAAMFFFPQLLYGKVFVEKTDHKKYGSSYLTDEDKEQIIETWLRFFENDTKPYLNPNLSLNEVARQLNMNPRHLSQVINEKTGTNFNDYVNSIRIEEAKRLLNSEDLKKLTINAIALKSGFNSKSPFYAAFKRHTGISPKQFIKSNNL